MDADLMLDKYDRIELARQQARNDERALRELAREHPELRRAISTAITAAIEYDKGQAEFYGNTPYRIGHVSGLIDAMNLIGRVLKC